MKKILSLLVLSLLTLVGFSQEDYFQQQVDYNIEVTLNDKDHTLSGVVEVAYTNNSPKALSEIYFHLWANAYKNHNTPFAKQLLRNRNTDFYYAKKKEMGGYTNVDFLINGANTNWKYAEDEMGEEVAIVQLNQPLAANSTVQIKVPFSLKIPKYFSRMGHVNHAYYISQWYPKPAVFDKDGWHPMPYLDQGEFYADFGKFDVTITLPENYVVGATGVLQTKSEQDFLEKKVKETDHFIKTSNGEDYLLLEKDTFPISSNNIKTIRYTAENVHDFAWFTDKRFFVQKSKVEISGGKKIDTWAFFNAPEFDLWLEATDYLNRSVQFYSEKVGVYPYPHATAVSNPYADAGAMEYPMITLVDLMGDAKYLDIVIAHEVGHNWFQGILGFNERDHAWMDEGLNSYYERRYTEKYYPDDKQEGLPKFMSDENQLGFEELILSSKTRGNTDQPPAAHSNEFTSMNYNMSVYYKTAVAFELLENYIGATKYEKVLQEFYEQWKFKHPQPSDLRNHLEKNIGEDLSWLFDGLIKSTKDIDYALASSYKSDGYNLKVVNKGELDAPFSISALKDGKVVKTEWYAGFSNEKNILFTDGDYDAFVIDHDRVSTDVNRDNNTIRTSGALKRVEPFQLKFLGGIENPARTTMYWLPALGWNHYDKTMLGVVLHNFSLAPQRVEFALAPMYSFASKELVGLGNIKYNIFPSSNLFRKITLSLHGKRFNYNYDWNYRQYENYLKVAPKVEFEFAKKSLTSDVTHKVSLRHINITENGIRGINFANREFERVMDNYYVNELKYSYEDDNVTAPLKASATVHQGNGFVKVFAQAQQFIPFAKRKKGMTLRAFAGAFPQFDNPDAFVSFQWSGVTGSNRDYLFDQLLFGRSEAQFGATQSYNPLSQQTFRNDAGLKTLSRSGISQRWMFGVGLSTSLPGPIPVRPYADATVFRTVAIDPDGNEILDTPFAYSVGLAFVAIPDALEIYLPLFESDNIKDSYETQFRDKYAKKIGVLINFDKILKKTQKEVLSF